MGLLMFAGGLAGLLGTIIWLASDVVSRGAREEARVAAALDGLSDAPVFLVTETISNPSVPVDITDDLSNLVLDGCVDGLSNSRESGSADTDTRPQIDEQQTQVLASQKNDTADLEPAPQPKE